MSTTQSEHPQSVVATTLSDEPSARSGHQAEQPVGVDRSLLRLRARAGLVGVALQVVMDRLHPHRIDPNDSAGVFREYAGSHDWTWVHIGWLGVVGAVAGAAIIAGGTVTAHTGFSSTASLILTPGTVLLALFAIGTFILMWGRDTHQ